MRSPGAQLDVARVPLREYTLIFNTGTLEQCAELLEMAISHPARLSTLALGFCGVTDAQVTIITETLLQCPNAYLRMLYLAYNTGITNVGATTIARRCALDGSRPKENSAGGHRGERRRGPYLAASVRCSSGVEGQRP